MIKLSVIQNTISDELKALNEIILQALHGENELLKSVVNTYLATKGKQIRPILVILSAKAFGKVTDPVLNGAAAIELLHNASLIHDDVVDDSKERRGLPTINKIWDNHIAVLVGDYFVSNALKCAVKTDDIRIIATMSNLGVELACGEIDQIDNARNHFVDEKNYYEIIRQKTASLFRSCVEVGGMAVKAEGENFDKLCEYAELLGLCFQIRDDIFDYYDNKEVGKPTGNDLREGKVTLPLIYALLKEGVADHDEMMELINKDSLTEEEINRLIEFAKREGGIEYAYQSMERLRDEANDLISELPDSEALKAFRTIFDYIIERNI